jgi:predicted RNA-binding Zn-ribbon protein involved in translation (DUF1610 family)
MSSRLLQPASEISTHFRCDNCGILLNRVTWMQCKICKAFDLCYECASTDYSDLPSKTLAVHVKLHNNAPINNDCMGLVFVGDAETDGIQARNKRRDKEYERILHDKTIHNDYDMSVVMDKLKRTTLSSTSDGNHIQSIIMDYNLRASKRNIRVLSLDGGGKNH